MNLSIYYVSSEKELLLISKASNGWYQEGRNSEMSASNCKSSRAPAFLISYLFLLDKHGVSKRKEAITLFHRLLISRQHMLSASQGRHQHNQRRLRQMEVGNQTVQDLKAISRIDEDIRPSALSF